MGSTIYKKSVIKKIRFLSFSFLFSLFLLPLFIVESSYSNTNSRTLTRIQPTLSNLQEQMQQTWADVQAAKKKLSAAYRDFLNASTDSERSSARTAIDAASKELSEAQNVYTSALGDLTAARSKSAESALSAASKASAAAKQAASEAAAAKAQSDAAKRELAANPNNAEAINRAAAATAQARAAAAQAQAQAEAACSAVDAAKNAHSQAPNNVSVSAVNNAISSCNDAKREAKNALAMAAEAGQAVSNEVQATNVENKERIDSATRKIEKQRKFLGFSAVANVAVGAYLLNRQCNPSPVPAAEASEAEREKCQNLAVSAGGSVTGAAADPAKAIHCYYTLGKLIGGPPNTVHGCILGPLALAQGIAHLKQRKSLKKTKRKLSGVTTGIGDGALYAGGVAGAGGGAISPAEGSSFGVDSEEDEPFQIPDLEIPCADDLSKTCLLTDEGETMTPLGGGGGGSSKPLSEMAGNLPTSSDDPEEQAEIDARIEALEEAVRANQDLVDQANALNPNTGSQSVAGNDPETPAFNFDPLGIGSGSGVNSGAGAASIGGLSGFDDAGGNTPELPAPPEGVYGPGGDSSGDSSFAGNVEGDSVEEGDSSDEDGSGAAYATYGRRAISGKGDGKSSSNKENSMPFGTDWVAADSTDMFNTIHSRYQVFRDSGQFIPPSTSGSVVTPTVPIVTE